MPPPSLRCSRHGSDSIAGHRERPPARDASSRAGERDLVWMAHGARPLRAPTSAPPGLSSARNMPVWKTSGSPRCGPQPVDLPDVQDVISGGVRVDDAAGELGQRAVEERQPQPPAERGRRGPPEPRAGEVQREALLVAVQDRDRVPPGGADPAVHLRARRDRDEHQRRIERDRGERVGRHPVDRVVEHRADDRHARGEPPQRARRRDGFTSPESIRRSQLVTAAACGGRTRQSG